MILPKIYEDAISCFCPRTAKMMKLSINNYLATGTIKISSRICAAPKAVLMLIFHDIHQNLNCSLTEKNCSLTEGECSLTEEKCSLTEGCSLTEEDQKEMEREETNIETLPPVPSIIDTSVEDKRKEKKEEKGGVEYARTRAHTRENFSFSEEQDFSHSEENGKKAADLNVLAGQRAEDPTGKISVSRAREVEKADGEKRDDEKTMVEKTNTEKNEVEKSEVEKTNTEKTVIEGDGTTTGETSPQNNPPDFETVEDQQEERLLLERMRYYRKMKDRIMNTHPKELIEYYNHETRGIFPPVRQVYPEIIMNARIALADIGMEKAKEVVRAAKKDFFLLGDNRSGFIASFRWLFEDKHYFKILNGEFHDRKNFDFDKFSRQQDYANYFAKQDAERRNGQRPASETVQW